MEKIKAYRVSVKGFPDCIVKSVSAGRARTVVLYTLHEVWSHEYTYADVKVRRAPDFDDWDIPVDTPSGHDTVMV